MSAKKWNWVQNGEIKRIDSSWYTLWLVTFDSLYQHLVCLSEAKWRLTWWAWYTHAISRSQNLLKRSEWSKERVWSLIWPVARIREKFANFWRSDGFRCYLTCISLRRHLCNLQCVNLFRLISIARWRFKVHLTNIRSRGAKFETFRKHGAYLHYILFTVASTRIS